MMQRSVIASHRFLIMQGMRRINDPTGSDLATSGT